MVYAMPRNPAKMRKYVDISMTQTVGLPKTLRAMIS